MAWPPPSTLPAEPQSDRWWHEWEYNRLVARGLAERRAREQAKRLRQLRRRVQALDEAIVLAEGASDARRALRRRGIPYEARSTHGYLEPDHGVEARRAGEVEHGPIGRVLRVR